MPTDARANHLKELAQDPGRHSALLSALEDPELSTRRTAIALAARYVSPELLIPLVRNGKNATLRNGARTILRRQVPSSFEVARLLVCDGDPDVVIIALEVLSEDSSIETFSQVVSLVDHPDANVSTAAIEALGRFAPELALSPLLRALSADTWRKMAAISALGMVSDPRAVRAVLPHLDNKPFREVCVSALSSLGTLEAFEAVARVADEAESDRAFLRAIRALIKIVEKLLDPGAARTALQRLFSPKTLVRLTSLRTSDDIDTRAFALFLSASVLPDEHLEAALSDSAVRKLGAGAKTLLAKLVESRAQALISSVDPGCRLAVLELSARAVPTHQLLNLLHDPDAGVRAATCAELAARGDARVVQTLVDALTRASGQERERAAQALLRFGEAGARAFDAAFARTSSEEQLAALLSCAPLTSIESLGAGALRAYARSADAGLRLAAVSAAARLSARDVEQVVVDALGDTDPRISAFSARVLAKRGRLELVLSLLERPSLSRFRIISALAQPGLYAAVEPLIALFSQAASHEQVEIVVTLGRIGGTHAVDFLAQRIHDREPAVRRAAAEAIATRPSLPDEEKLVALARDEEWSVRRWAVDGLVRLGSRRARAVLLELARDVDDGVLEAARNAIRSAGAEAR